MDLDKCRLIAVQGDVNSGKTNLGVYLLRTYPGKRKIYTLGYPIKLDNYIPLANKNQLNLVQDGIIFIDELHKFFRLYDKNTSREFIELVSLSAHNNNTIIFTTQLSQNLTKTMEAFVDGFCITHIQDLSTLKNGSRIKRCIENCADIRKTSAGLFLDKGEFLSVSDYDEVGEGGIHSFPNQSINKDWRMRKKVQETIEKEQLQSPTGIMGHPTSPQTYSSEGELRLQKRVEPNPKSEQNIKG